MIFQINEEELYFIAIDNNLILPKHESSFEERIGIKMVSEDGSNFLQGISVFDYTKNKKTGKIVYTWVNPLCAYSDFKSILSYHMNIIGQKGINKIISGNFSRYMTPPVEEKEIKQNDKATKELKNLINKGLKNKKILLVPVTSKKDIKLIIEKENIDFSHNLKNYEDIEEYKKDKGINGIVDDILKSWEEFENKEKLINFLKKEDSIKQTEDLPEGFIKGSIKNQLINRIEEPSKKSTSNKDTKSKDVKKNIEESKDTKKPKEEKVVTKDKPKTVKSIKKTNEKGEK